MSSLLTLKWARPREGYRVAVWNPPKGWYENRYRKTIPKELASLEREAVLRELDDDTRRLAEKSEELYRERQVDSFLLDSIGRELILEWIGTEPEIYDPFQLDSCLFREFAALEPTPKEIILFANRYGNLKRPWFEDVNISKDVPNLQRDVVIPMLEDVEIWESEIEEMREAVGLWDKCRHTDISRVVELINRRPSSKAAANVPFGISAECILKLHDDRAGATVQFQPLDLLDGMWIEFALAVHGSANLRTCEACPTWFEVAPGSSRVDKKFCSDACKMRAYRKRLKLKKS